MNRPMVYVGRCPGKTLLPDIHRLGWGQLWWDGYPREIVPGPWAFDNGAYNAWRSGISWDGGVYLDRVDNIRAEFKCPTIAIVPDIVGEGLDSLRFSLSWLPKLPAEWPLYLAVQDGMPVDAVQSEVDAFDGLFLGGTNAFKATADVWANLARRNGKLFHYGRCGTLRKLAHAIRVKADSLDSSFPLWTRDRFVRFASVWEHGHEQQEIPFCT